MNNQSTTQQTELARRAGDGIEVALVWLHGDGGDRVVVTVQNRRDGSSFEIPAEPYLALDVYYHPFVYRDARVLDGDGLLAEVVG